MKMIYICNIMDFSPLFFHGINTSSSWFLPPAPFLGLYLQNDLQVSFSSYDMHVSSSSSSYDMHGMYPPPHMTGIKHVVWPISCILSLAQYDMQVSSSSYDMYPPPHMTCMYPPHHIPPFWSYHQNVGIDPKPYSLNPTA